MGERRYWIRFLDEATGEAAETAAPADDARARGLRLRPASAPAGGAVAVCPHCWQVNVGGERLCGRCGADMTLLLQESGGLRRTPAVQSPVPVRVSGRLGPVTRALLLVLTLVLALAWLVVPLLGAAYRRAYGRQQLHSPQPLQRQLHSPQRSQRARRFTEAEARRIQEFGTIPATESALLKL